MSHSGASLSRVVPTEGRSPVDRVTCLVDNCVWGSALWGEHGLSFLIQTGAGNVLWDTGQSGTVLAHNLREMDLAKVPLHAAALSHAHYDHTGGLNDVLESHPRLAIYAHETLFRERFSQREGSASRAVGLADQRESLLSLASWHLSDAPTEIVKGLWTTGGIHQRRYPLGSSRFLMLLQDGALVPDAYTDDLSLVLHVEGGIVVLCGCCHAGLRNTLATVRQHHSEPLLAVIGGTHLAGADAQELDQVIDALQAEGRPMLHLNHCTGEKALFALASAFGERVAPCPAGTRLEFESKRGS